MTHLLEIPLSVQGISQYHLAVICFPFPPLLTAWVQKPDLLPLAQQLHHRVFGCQREGCCAHKDVRINFGLLAPQLTLEHGPSLRLLPSLLHMAGCAQVVLQPAELLYPLPHLACKDWDGWTMENNPMMLMGLFAFTVRPLQQLLRWCAGLCREPWDASVVQRLTSDTEVHCRFSAESCWNCLCFWGSTAYCCCLVCVD